MVSHAHTVVGAERARAMEPTCDLLEIATRKTRGPPKLVSIWMTAADGKFWAPDQDFREILQRALLGGLLRGDELFAVRELLRAARFNRTELGRHEEIPLLSSVAENIPELGDLERAISGSISSNGEVLDNASPVLHNLRQDARNAQNRLKRHHGS
ncbi:MAG: hypothetical protein Ct9H300mP11_25000 [Chloroflexota bacterium]|nr:MAG: hypothetical protein Ct9H300mP11_25000 [Chloroflexota bacterium]